MLAGMFSIPANCVTKWGKLYMNKHHKTILIPAICIAAFFTMSACADSKMADTQQKNTADKSDTQQGIDIAAYEKKLADNRENYKLGCEQYSTDTDTVKNTDYRNLSFTNCTFKDMPETDELYVMEGGVHGITTQESWDTIKDWLESIGKLDTTDMDSEVRIINSDLGMDDTKETPYSYPALKDHMDLASGAGALVNTNECHIQIADNGIYSMSDGKIGAYLNTDAHASSDALGTYTDDVVKSGTIDELGKESYQLINGELTIEQGAELTGEYFEKGTPFVPTDGITLSVPEVRVFRLGQVYGYDYMVQRQYHGVPIAYHDYGNYQIYGNEYNFEEDIKHAYVVDSDGVSAYAGVNDSEPLENLYSSDEILGIKDAADILSGKMAKFLNVDVQSVCLTYVPLNLGDGSECKIYLPAWQFDGINRTKDENIRMYLDAFTGEVYYYTYGEAA